MKKKKNTAKLIKVSPDLMAKVKTWFFNALMPGDGYTVCAQHNELVMLVNSCPVCGNNWTVLQCMNWISGRYGQKTDYKEVRSALIDCVYNYTDIQ